HAARRWRGVAFLLILALLALPMAWPALHGLGGAVVAGFKGGSLTGPALEWSDARQRQLLLGSVALSLMSAMVATLAAALVAATLLMPQPRVQRLAFTAALAMSFCFGTVVHLLAWRTLFPVVTGGPLGWGLAALTMGLRYAPLAG
ncbi:MAG TPA: hypothetical protein VFP68_15915, partial [Burkholderiaceae bacterium]|nr:hypothetical protein [Burkholderiaceae bacterium]